MTQKMCAPLALFLVLSACDGGTAQTNQPDDAASLTGIPVVTTGSTLCRGGAPGLGFQIPATQDIPAGGDATLVVSAPPSSPALKNPARAMIRCQVDFDWCAGSTCRKYPLVDFIGKDGQGMTWKQISVDGQAQSARFTTKVHNGDIQNHTIHLVLEMPDNWKPRPDDTSGQ